MKKAFVLLSILLIVGCTQFDTLTNNTTTPVSNDSLPLRKIPVANNTANRTIIEPEVNASGIALFFSNTISSQEKYMRSIDTSWESSSKGVFRYLPESSVVDAIKVYTSASWSKSSCYAFTVDGRLFIARDWDSDWTADDATWGLEEYEPVSGDKLSTIQFEAGSFAVINDKVYYNTPIIKDFYGRVTGGGDLKVQSLTSSSSTLVKEDFSGRLYGVGDYLLAVMWNYIEETLNISTVDLSSGAVTLLYTMSDANSPTNDLFPGHNAMYHLVEDGSIIYINRYPVVGEAKTILTVELTGDEERVYVGEDNGIVALLIIDSSYKIIGLNTYDLTTEEISEVSIMSFSSPISYTRIGVPFLILT